MEEGRAEVIIDNRAGRTRENRASSWHHRLRGHDAWSRPPGQYTQLLLLPLLPLLRLLLWLRLLRGAPQARLRAGLSSEEPGYNSGATFAETTTPRGPRRPRGAGLLVCVVQAGELPAPNGSDSLPARLGFSPFKS